MLQISHDYHMSVCEVKTLENDFLLTGVITEITEEYIQIGGYRGERLPLVRFDMPVKISIHNAKVGFKVLAGTAYLSTDKMLRIVEVQNLQDYERRAFFRVAVHLPAKAIAIDSETNLPCPDKTHDIFLENISLSGALFCFVKDESPFLMGDAFVLQFEAATGTMRFNCKVCRTEQWGQRSTRFGCEFFDFTTHDSDVLCRFIFDLQREMIRKKRNFM